MGYQMSYLDFDSTTHFESDKAGFFLRKYLFFTPDSYSIEKRKKILFLVIFLVTSFNKCKTALNIFILKHISANENRIIEQKHAPLFYALTDSTGNHACQAR